MRLRSDGSAPGGIGTRRDSKTGFPGTADEELLEVAGSQDCPFVTRDRDFGRIVFLNRRRGAVIYLRVLPTTQDAVHAELAEARQLYGAPDL
ncbi:MAG: DUF5615 family PIN-like protein, partial [Rhodospirillaceae bacterium]|nr:DUF5615 family PIN-like protein [Rhodospirillaceae bacterium]